MSLSKKWLCHFFRKLLLRRILIHSFHVMFPLTKWAGEGIISFTDAKCESV